MSHDGVKRAGDTTFDSALWTELKNTRYPSRAEKIFDALLAQVTHPRAVEALRLFESAERDDRYWAGRILLRLPEGTARLLDTEQRARLITAALENSRRAFPGSRLGRVSIRLLEDHAPARAWDFLLNEVAYMQLSSADLDEYAQNLSSKPPPEGLRRLQELAEMGSAWARRSLDDKGLYSKERFEEWRTDWRTRRSSDALDKLYHSWFVHLRPSTTTFAELVDVLGPPDRSDGLGHWYDAPDAGMCLYVETDEQGRLAGWRMSS